MILRRCGASGHRSAFTSASEVSYCFSGHNLFEPFEGYQAKRPPEASPGAVFMPDGHDLATLASLSS